MSRQEDLQDYQNWVDNFYSAVGKMPRTTFGDWQNHRVVMADLLELQHAEATENEEPNAN